MAVRMASSAAIGVGGIAVQQNFSTDAMQFSVEGLLTGARRSHERLVDDLARAIKIPGLRFLLRQRAF